MRRRTFISLVGGAAAWPLAARGQQQTIPVVGFLGVAPASGWAGRLAGLRAGFHELGYVEGSNLDIELRWGVGPAELTELAAQLVKREVAVIVSGGNAATGAAKTATSKIPIVFGVADDPVRLGYVTSFNQPGGNMTGLSTISGALGAKRLELLRQLVPNATVIALLRNPTNPAEANARDVQEAARSIGQRLLVLDASTVPEIEQAFAVLAQQQAGALLVNADALFTTERELLAALAARHRLPAMYAWREFAEAGGLMCYGTSLPDSYRQIGVYAARILKGEKPADLPVMQPTKFEFVINLKTVKALGLTVPDKLLAVADDVIE
jgi:putative ABC transport system substrate-binding protein